MAYGDLQFFDIIIFAAIAVFIIYRLRGVLGKRTGFQKKPVDQQFVKKQPTQKKEETKIPQLRESEQKLENVYKKIPSFEHKAFLEGAKKAFEIIITAFNKGDKTTLKNLVSKDNRVNTNQSLKKETNNKQIITFKALEKDVALHKKTFSETKDAVWKKYNY